MDPAHEVLARLDKIDNIALILVAASFASRFQNQSAQ